MGGEKLPQAFSLGEIMKITKNQDGTYLLSPTVLETEMLDTIQGQQPGEFKTLVEQWIITKFHNNKIEQGKRLVIKFVNASTSDQAAVLAILN